ncbi:MAG: hypothetical protein ACJASM_000908 [Salibacteraceae bacterium]|jgi:hypothetical protein
MFIIDPKSQKQIKITDLPKAIEQADTFRNYANPAVSSFEKETNEHWTDIYSQLMILDGWVTTDYDTQQYRKQISEDCFMFCEDRISNPETNSTYSFESKIDLKKYSQSHIIDCCKSFGYETNQALRWIQKGSENALIAECIFELE